MEKESERVYSHPILFLLPETRLRVARFASNFSSFTQQVKPASFTASGVAQGGGASCICTVPVRMRGGTRRCELQTARSILLRVLKQPLHILYAGFFPLILKLRQYLLKQAPCLRMHCRSYMLILIKPVLKRIRIGI